MNQIRAPETKSHTHALQAFKKTFFMRYFLFFSSCFFFFRGRKIHEQEAMKTQHTGSFYYRHHDIKIEAKPVDQPQKSMEIHKSRAVLPKTNGSRYQNQQQQASKLSSEQQHAVVKKVFLDAKGFSCPYFSLFLVLGQLTS